MIPSCDNPMIANTLIPCTQQAIFISLDRFTFLAAIKIRKNRKYMVVPVDTVVITAKNAMMIKHHNFFSENPSIRILMTHPR